MSGNTAIHVWTLSPEEEQALRANDATFEWLCCLPPDQLRQYSGQWVAAKDCRVMATGKTMEALLAQLGDVNVQDVIIDRIEKPVWMIYR